MTAADLTHITLMAGSPDRSADTGPGILPLRDDDGVLMLMLMPLPTKAKALISSARRADTTAETSILRRVHRRPRGARARRPPRKGPSKRTRLAETLNTTSYILSEVNYCLLAVSLARARRWS